MAGVEDRVVAMSFESGRFEAGASRALSMLDRLKAALRFPNAGKDLEGINAAAGRVNLSGIQNGVDSIKSRLGALRLAAVAAFAMVAQQALAAGARVVKAFTIGPVIAGFKEYETQMNAVQTILANTASAGTKLKDVNAALAELNTYADKTIYNFSEMTHNIGTFTAAGVDLKTAVASIKGIANLAALSGSNSQQASTAMYQLSQAISAGRVGLQDWNSVVNAGMGGTIFQRALAQTAVHMGALSDGAVQLKGKMKNVTIEGKSFRESIMAAPGKKSWLTGDVLTKTLAQLSGNLSDAQLKAEGYSNAQIKAIQAQAKTALDAATKVKTLSQLFDTLKEAMGSGWAQTFQILLGNFGEAKTLFTGLSNSIGGFISASAKARNKVLGDWKALGGRTVLISGLKTAFQNLGAILKPIKEAFRDIFPRATGQQLYDLTVKFKAFAESIKPSEATINNLHRTFRGLFAAFDIGKQIVGGIFTVIGKLFGAVGKGGGGFLSLTGNIGDFIVKIDQALKKGNLLHNFFSGLGAVLAVPIRLFEKVGEVIGNLFSGLSGNASGGFSQAITSALGPVQGIINGVEKAWNRFVNSFSGAGSNIPIIIQNIADAFSNIGQSISTAFSGINVSNILGTLSVGLLGGIFLLIRKFVKTGFGDALSGIGGGILESIGGSFKALTGSLTAMQQNIKANTLLQIAIAIGVLTASIVALSTINEKDLNKALSGLGIAFAELLGAMAILNKISSSGGFLKVPIIAGAMVVLAIAIGLLTLSVKSLSKLSWSELSKGLIGVSVLLGGLALAAKPLSASSAGLIRAGVGITVIAIALRILASAVKAFGGMSWTELGKGIGSVAASLVAIGVASKLFPKGMVSIGAGLILIAVALNILAAAIAKFGGMNWGAILKGLAGIGGALVIIAGAMRVMPKGMMLQAAGLVVVALALKQIASAVGAMGGLSIEKIAKGLGTLAGSLIILAVGLKAMTGSIGGAIALTIASAGLVMLAQAMSMLGSMSVGSIAKSLIALGAAMGILGLAGALIAPIVPAIIALGVAMLAAGAGFALFGAGIALIGTGLSAIAIAGPAAVSILLKAVEGLAKMIPQLLLQVANGIVAFVVRLGQAAPQFVGAIAKLLGVLLTAIIQNAPKLAQAFVVLITSACKAIVTVFPLVVQTGMQLLMQLLRGINANIVQITNMAINIVVRFLGAIANNLGRVISAGANLLIKFLNGIANNLGRVITAAFTVVVRFITGISNNLGRIVAAGSNLVVRFVIGIGNQIGRVISAGVNMVIKLVSGIANNFSRLVRAGVDAAGRFIMAVAREIPRLAGKGADAVIAFVNGVAGAVRSHSAALGAAGGNLASALVEGMASGLAAGAGRIAGSVGNLLGGIPNAAKKLLGISSPSTVFYEIGANVVRGLVQGLDANASTASSAVEDMTVRLVKAVNEIPGKLNDIANMNPVITPVLDLTRVKAGADEMSGMIRSAPLVASTSYGQASSISTEKATDQSTESQKIPGTPSVSFQQNNYSPKALSEVEIYRQTRNQLSQVRSVLTKA